MLISGRLVDERALLAALAIVAANLTDGDLMTVDWRATAIGAGTAALLSVLMALLNAGGKGNPTVVNPVRRPLPESAQHLRR